VINVFTVAHMAKERGYQSSTERIHNFNTPAKKIRYQVST
jgi:hypothetical protein